MMSQEQNDALTRTNAGTLMGDLFRRFWIPALHDWELPEPDCAPVRVQLLGEKLIAFRDRVGPFGGLLMTGIDWGGKNRDWENESMRLLVQDVMPKFRQHTMAERASNAAE